MNCPATVSWERKARQRSSVNGWLPLCAQHIMNAKTWFIESQESAPHSRSHRGAGRVGVDFKLKLSIEMCSYKASSSGSSSISQSSLWSPLKKAATVGLQVQLDWFGLNLEPISIFQMFRKLAEHMRCISSESANWWFALCVCWRCARDTMPFAAKFMHRVRRAQWALHYRAVSLIWSARLIWRNWSTCKHSTDFQVLLLLETF